MSKIKYQERKLGRKTKGSFVDRKPISAKYSGNCSGCFENIKVGSMIIWMGPGKSTYHLRCYK